MICTYVLFQAHEEDSNRTSQMFLGVETNRMYQKVLSIQGTIFIYYVSTYGFHQVWYQGIVKATVSGVFEDLKFKISEGSENFNFACSILKF